MVAGDVVSEISLAGAAINFQPAVGVNVMISCYFNGGAGRAIQTNGVTSAQPMGDTYRNAFNCKWFVNNTNYFQILALGGISNGFNGVQIK